MFMDLKKKKTFKIHMELKGEIHYFKIIAVDLNILSNERISRHKNQYEYA